MSHTRKLKNIFLSLFLKYLDLRRDKENEEETRENIITGIDFKGTNLWVLIFAIFIASLGLNVNSTAVIIGAMLISPLMGPILGMGLALGTNDVQLFKRSGRSLLVATFFSVLTATIYFSLTPISTAQSELLARTSPTIYDVFIAFFGGLAGIVAIATKGKGNVIPGVAIATALMPPLCTVGFGLGTGHFLYALGALYLYFINTVFITLATVLGVRLLRFARKPFASEAGQRKARNYFLLVVILTVLPATYMTYTMVRETVFTAGVRRFVSNEMHWNNTRVISQKADVNARTIDVVLVGQVVPDSLIAAARRNLESYHLEGVTLKVIQGQQSDSILLGSLTDNVETQSALLQAQGDRIARLTDSLRTFTRYTRLGARLQPEAHLLFPAISSLSLAHTQVAFTQNNRIDTTIVAVVGITTTLSPADRKRLFEWLKVRCETKKLQLILTALPKEQE